MINEGFGFKKEFSGRLGEEETVSLPASLISGHPKGFASF
jgi:hypothetical protein